MPNTEVHKAVFQNPLTPSQIPPPASCELYQPYFQSFCSNFTESRLLLAGTTAQAIEPPCPDSSLPPTGSVVMDPQSQLHLPCLTALLPLVTILDAAQRKKLSGLLTFLVLLF